MSVDRPDHVTLDAIRHRLNAVEKLRETWKGNPDYIRTLDIDIYALRIAFTETSRKGG